MKQKITRSIVIPALETTIEGKPEEVFLPS